VGGVRNDFATAETARTARRTGRGHCGPAHRRDGCAVPQPLYGHLMPRFQPTDIRPQILAIQLVNRAFT
jgi:hypothetical protein